MEFTSTIRIGFFCFPAYDGAFPLGHAAPKFWTSPSGIGSSVTGLLGSGQVFVEVVLVTGNGICPWQVACTAAEFLDS